jgi:N-acetylated-alpha-linked acidic dipeptidase
LKSGAYQLANDPKNSLAPPPELPMPPAMDFAALDTALEKLKSAAAHYAQASAKAPDLSAEKRKQINDGLALAERKLIAADGLPGRPWTKHLIYAPGTYTGYGASTLPGVREALEAGRFDEAKQQLDVLVQALNDESALIDGLANLAGQ